MQYVSIALAKFYSELTYKLNFITGLIGDALGVLISVFVWIAVYKTSSSDVIAGFDVNEMILYLIISNLGMILLSTDIVTQMGSFIKKGKLTTMLLRPYSILACNFSSYVGKRLVYIIPYLIIMVILLPSSIRLNYYALVLLFGIVNFFMFFILMQCIGNLGFFVIEMWPIRPLVNSIYLLLGGIYFPLSLLPENIFSVMKLTPFALVGYDFTVAVQNKLTIEVLWQYTVISVIWLILFYGIYKFTFKRGLKKYEGMGA